MNTEFLLLDVLRMVDEWPMLAKRLTRFDMVLRKVNPMATLDSLMGTPLEKNRSFQMEVIYDLVDGQRSVKEIIDLSFVEEFETCKNLILLMDAGLVESPAGSVKKEPGGEKKSQVAKHLADAGAYFLVGILALLLFFQFTEARSSKLPFYLRRMARLASAPGFRQEGLRNQSQERPGGLFPRREPISSRPL